MVQPDAGSVQVFGLDPVAAVRAGRVGAMLQAGALLQDTSVSDLLRLMHGLHAHPLPMAEIIERADVAASGRPRPTSCPAARRNGCATRWRSCPTPTC